MELGSLSLEDLYKEIELRKAAETKVIREQLEAAKKLVRDLEAKLAETSGIVPPAAKSPKLPKSSLSGAEKAERIFTALDGKGFVSGAELAGLVGFDGNGLRDALQDLLTEGRIAKEGKARGTKYKLI
jgi:hypothetical protein